MSFEKVILREWASRTHNGKPNIHNKQHISTLVNVLVDYELSESFINTFIQNLTEADNTKSLSDDEKEKAKQLGLTHLGNGIWGKDGNASHKSVDGKLEKLSPDEIKQHNSNSDNPAAAAIDNVAQSGQETPTDTTDTEDSSSVNPEEFQLPHEKEQKSTEPENEIDKEVDSLHKQINAEHNTSTTYVDKLKEAEQNLVISKDVINTTEVKNRIVTVKKSTDLVVKHLPTDSPLSFGATSGTAATYNVLDVITKDTQIELNYQVLPGNRSSSVQNLSAGLEQDGWEILKTTEKFVQAISPDGSKYKIYSKPARGESSKKAAGQSVAYEGTVALAYGIAYSGLPKEQWGDVISNLMEFGTYNLPDGTVVDTKNLRADALSWFTDPNNTEQIHKDLDTLLVNKNIAIELAAAKDLMKKMNLPEGTKLRVDCEGGADTDEFRADIVIYAESPKGVRYALIGSSVKDGTSDQLGQLGPRKAVSAIMNTEPNSEERKQAILGEGQYTGRDYGYINQIKKLPASVQQSFFDKIVALNDPKQIHIAMLDAVEESSKQNPEALYDFLLFNIVGTNPPDNLGAFVYQNESKISTVPLPGSKAGADIKDHISELIKNNKIRRSTKRKPSDQLVYVDDNNNEYPLIQTRTKSTSAGKIERTYIQKGGAKSVLFKLLRGEI